MEKAGAGEIIINSIDRDGTMQGYDKELIAKVYQTLRIPITALGGAGSLDDIQEIIATHRIIGAAAGSLFVFKGKYRAVLINYPTATQKETLFSCVSKTLI